MMWHTSLMRDDAHTLGAKLEGRRAKAGQPSYRALARQLYDMLGVYAPTDESIRRLHIGRIPPDKVDPLVLAALCDIYGCTIKDVSRLAAERSKTASDLLKRQSRCTARSLAAA